MAKINYNYNDSTLSYEIESVPLKKKLRRLVLWLTGSMAASTVVIMLMSHYMDTPRTLLLRRQIDALQVKYAGLTMLLQDKDNALNQLMLRDNSVYRSIFEVPQIPISMREGKYEQIVASISHDITQNSDMMWKLSSLLERVTQKAYIQSKSFDEISSLAQQKEQMIVSIPSIQPVNISDRRIHISAVYGYRRDPIFRTETRMHDGIDFAGPIGMPVYVTGNGRVITAEYNFNGYGNHVVVSHGFGYETRYAHLSRINVHVGDIVTRGGIIGALGNTGKSTGPHLHYEVRYHGRPVNPINFFADDVNSAEYNKIIRALQGELSGGTEF
jgi:murein DD-endopeptidase MepM/ murein hydrolase activator NlpD